MLNVIYEDNHLLVCEKPANMPVQADSSGDRDILTEAKDYIKRKYGKPGEVYLGLVHRLDRPVGGVMVFARTSKAAARLTDAMKARRVKKRYAAIVTNSLPAYGNLINYIVKDEATHSARLVSENIPGAQRASLDYSVVSKKGGRTLLDVQLHTGRHHQIRVQLAGAGSPIYGDQRYNPEAQPGQQIALYAYSLTFEHPTLKENMTFTCVPNGDSWSGFSEELTALSCGVRCPYIDKDVVAVNKDPYIACTIRDGGEDTVEARLVSAFGEIYPVHRLDAPTTGLVLFARNPEAANELEGLIRERKFKKYYHTRVFGVPSKKEDVVTLYQEKDPERSEVSVFSSPTRHSKEMITGYRVLETGRIGGEMTSLLEVELFTGRTHQIRASLAFLGCPIVGDDKYGDRQRNKAVSGGLRLCAVRIEFPKEMQALPQLRGKVLTVEAPFESEIHH